MDRMRLFKQTIEIKDDMGIYGYLAGMLDADGSIIMMRRERNDKIFYDTFIQVTNTNKDLMDWLVENFGGYYRDETKYKKNEVLTHKKPIYSWRLQRTRDLVPILKLVIPYLIIKKDKGMRVLNYRKSRILLADG